jgi:hypothetical protein
VAVIPMQLVSVKPKSERGRRSNAEWSITYDMTKKLWHWSVTITLSPQVFKGEAATLADARKEVAQCMPNHKL